MLNSNFGFLNKKLLLEFKKPWIPVPRERYLRIYNILAFHQFYASFYRFNEQKQRHVDIFA